jgi:hypothetical protein
MNLSIDCNRTLDATQNLHTPGFNVPPQFYGFQPADEVIQRSRTGEARSGYATEFNPWWLTNPYINYLVKP